MNSLLQSLYLSPEFCDTLFSWRYQPLANAQQIQQDEQEALKAQREQEMQAALASAETDEEVDAILAMMAEAEANPVVPSSENSSSDEADKKRRKRCIPLQLQRLFGRLRFGERAAVETSDLTHSFGWTDVDAFQQHDVQELRLVLFEALEKVFRQQKDQDGEVAKGSADRGARLRQMFEGEVESYVECSRCKSRNPRTEGFSDLQLVVRDFHSLEESLAAYLHPDVLEGDNQYSCSVCESRQDALKKTALRFLPPILTLQLKRFDYNMRTWAREKLHHRFTFPFTFDASKFCDPSSFLGSTDVCFSLLLFSLFFSCSLCSLF